MGGATPREFLCIGGLVVVSPPPPSVKDKKMSQIFLFNHRCLTSWVSNVLVGHILRFKISKTSDISCFYSCSHVADEDSDGDNFRLRHGDHCGGAEEGGGQAEGPHPLTGGQVLIVTDLLSNSQGEELMRVKKATVSDTNFKYFVLDFS